LIFSVLLLCNAIISFISVTLTPQSLDVIYNFDDGSDEVTCAAFNPVNPCIFAFADVCGNVGLRALDRPLDAGLAGAVSVDFAVNCMGDEPRGVLPRVVAHVTAAFQAGRVMESYWRWGA
jgi:hypothetical protein